MQCLRDKHGKTIIKGGKLAGASYESVEEEKLRKVAKRYTGDPEFVKYARGCVVLLDLQAGEEPLACVPLQPPGKRESESVSQISFMAFKTGAIKWVQAVWRNRILRFAFLASIVAFILRPSVSPMLARTTVSFFRLTFRRLFSFIGILIEGMVDEVIMQLEHTLHEQLPSPEDVRETAKQLYHFVSHVLSGILGATLGLLCRQRQMPVAA